MKSTGFLQRSALATVLAIALLLAAGCGGSGGDGSSDTSPTTKWADGLCSAISTWTSSISSIGDTIKGGDISKDSLTSAVDDAKSATETFTSDLDSLGKPDTEAGQQAKDSIDQLSSELKDEVATIQDELDGASGITGIIAAIPTITTSLSNMGTQVSSTISDLESLDAKGELESAFKDSSSCDDLTGS
jgi:hypothetical protein